MEPISMAIMTAVSLGVQLFGMSQSMAGASAGNAAQMQAIGAEKKIESLKYQQMYNDYQRKSLENLRNVQRYRSMALAMGVQQGSQFGSALGGANSQFAAQGAWNQVGLNQQLETAQGVYKQDQIINNAKMAMAQAGMQVQFGSGLSSLGGSLMSSASSFGRLASGFASASPSGSASGPAMYAALNAPGYGGA